MKQRTKKPCVNYINDTFPAIRANSYNFIHDRSVDYNTIYTNIIEAGLHQNNALGLQEEGKWMRKI